MRKYLRDHIKIEHTQQNHLQREKKVWQFMISGDLPDELMTKTNLTVLKMFLFPLNFRDEHDSDLITKFEREPIIKFFYEQFNDRRLK